jgi:hypothetical protein
MAQWQTAAQCRAKRRAALPCRQAIVSFMSLAHTQEHGLRWGFCVTVTEPHGVL